MFQRRGKGRVSKLGRQRSRLLGIRAGPPPLRWTLGKRGGSKKKQRGRQLKPGLRVKEDSGIPAREGGEGPLESSNRTVKNEEREGKVNTRAIRPMRQGKRKQKKSRQEAFPVKDLGGQEGGPTARPPVGDPQTLVDHLSTQVYTLHDVSEKGHQWTSAGGVCSFAVQGRRSLRGEKK